MDTFYLDFYYFEFFSKCACPLVHFIVVSNDLFSFSGYAVTKYVTTTSDASKVSLR